ncbi:hypothetical protein EYB45_00735 [Erythrobacteraceae bacterium CFH 75059]|uniref:flagellar filament capping protein FliD n=1 Tax=Qipengyuania thermophila TaxID=2509361 RepID=UPI0010229A86|nr:flagellar filament capping protein FliD [Qipengyuania thermophila]TCD06298.1 hypothetical protein EYB45_00735 [Erythrobacteraceae bacterium CFH 75059]
MSGTPTVGPGAVRGGSGVDINALAADLAAARFTPRIKALQGKSQAVSVKLDAAANLRAKVAQLAAAFGERVRAGALAPQASVTPPGVATASLLPGAVLPAPFTLEVHQLACGQVWVGPPYDAPDARVGAGQLEIAFGAVSGSAFDPDPERAPLRLDLGPDDTLTTLARRVEAARVGLSAQVLQGEGGARLVLKGPDGSANGFVLRGSAAEPDGGPSPQPSPAALSWALADGTAALHQVARDAQLSLDGVTIRHPSNRFTEPGSGLVLALSSTSSGQPATITFAAALPAMREVMADLAAALDEVGRSVRDVAAPLGGPIGADSGARLLKRLLADLPGSTVMPRAAEGAPRTLADLGLASDGNGGFAFESHRFDRRAAEDPQAVAAFFTAGLHGAFATLDRLARTAGLSTDPGSLGGSVRRYEAQQARMELRRETLLAQQEALRQQLTRRLARSEGMVRASNSVLAQLELQIGLARGDRR